jgi:hypothetical protein
MILRRRQRADIAGIRLWPGRPWRARAFNALVEGAGTISWVQGGLERCGNSLGGLGPSSEAEIRPRGCQALERGVDSPEGASSPRARRRFHGAALGPRARRRFARGVPRLAIWWAVEAFRAVGLSLPWAATRVIRGCRLRLLLLFSKRGDFPHY